MTYAVVRSSITAAAYNKKPGAMICSRPCLTSCPSWPSCPSCDVRSASCPSCLEVHLDAELPEPRLQHARRRQPRGRSRRERRAERLVVAENRRRVEQVVEVEPDVGPR